MLNGMEGIEQCRVEVSSRFAALEDLDAEVDINSAWETVDENIKILAIVCLGYFELKKYKPWFDERCSELLDQREQAKLQWLQDPSEINWDNLNNVRREASRVFRNKKKEYLKGKINGLATNEFKRGYQPRSNLVKDGIGDLLADSHNILNRWKNYFNVTVQVLIRFSAFIIYWRKHGSTMRQYINYS
jgi:hypothetical protein